MTIDRLVFAVAGLFIVLTVALTFYHHPYWMLGTLFVGVNMLQAALTGWCPLAIMLKKLGARRGYAFG